MVAQLGPDGLECWCCCTTPEIKGDEEWKRLMDMQRQGWRYDYVNQRPEAPTG